MQFHIESRDNTTLIALVGSLCSESADETRASLIKLLKANNYRLVLDLSSVDTVDPAGLAAIVTAHNRAREAGGDIVLLNPNAELRQTLEMVRLHHLFQIFDEERLAVERIAA